MLVLQTITSLLDRSSGPKSKRQTSIPQGPLSLVSTMTPVKSDFASCFAFCLSSTTRRTSPSQTKSHLFSGINCVALPDFRVSQLNILSTTSMAKTPKLLASAVRIKSETKFRGGSYARTSFRGQSCEWSEKSLVAPSAKLRIISPAGLGD